MTKMMKVSAESKRLDFVVGTLHRTGLFREFIGWCFAYSVVNGLHRFTATLSPKGRGSTLEDWEFLGRVAARLGASPEMPASIKTDPNATHVWEWSEAPRAA